LILQFRANWYRAADDFGISLLRKALLEQRNELNSQVKQVDLFWREHLFCCFEARQSASISQKNQGNGSPVVFSIITRKIYAVKSLLVHQGNENNGVVSLKSLADYLALGEILSTTLE